MPRKDYLTIFRKFNRDLDFMSSGDADDLKVRLYAAYHEEQSIDRPTYYFCLAILRALANFYQYEEDE